MRCVKGMAGFSGCHQPLTTAWHRRWQRKDIPQSWLSCQPVSYHEHIIIIFSPQESELTELKDTIEILKVKNTEAQEIIQGALSNPEMTPKGTECAAGCAVWLGTGLQKHTKRWTFNVLSLILICRTADQSSELLREHLQPHQHHQPLQYG